MKLFRSVYSIWHSISRNRFLSSPPKRGSRKCLPAIEQLEGRIVPAVTAQIESNTLKVIMDSDDNLILNVAITNVGSPQQPDFQTVLFINSNTLIGSPVGFNLVSFNKLEVVGQGDFTNDISLFGTLNERLEKSLVISIDAGPGNDIIRASPISRPNENVLTEILGGSGNDQIFSRAVAGQTMTLDGGLGNDTLVGDRGDEVLIGGPNTLNPGQTDNDFLVGNAGTDGLDGGAGNDFLDDGIFDDSANIELFVGGPGDDEFLPRQGSQLLIGDTGNDVYNYAFVNTFNRSVNDTIRETGGDGVLNDPGDKLRFNQDSGYSAPGNAGADSGIEVDLSTTVAQQVVSGITITLENATSMERVDGTPRNDKITGNSRDNILDGGGNEAFLVETDKPNKDMLFGKAGNDVLRGDTRDQLPRDNTVVGSTFDGGEGNDLLISTIGDDILRGGPDSDTYQTQRILGSFAFGHDTIEEEGECVDDDLLLLGAVRRRGADGEDDPFGEIISNSVVNNTFFNETFDVISTERQELLALELNGEREVFGEVTISNDQGLERALGHFGAFVPPNFQRADDAGSGFNQIRGIQVNANCLGSNVDLQIRAAHERAQDFGGPPGFQTRLPDEDNEQLEVVAVPQTVTATYFVKVTNTGTSADSFFLRAVEETTDKFDFTIVYRDDTGAVVNNDAITLESLETKLLAPGESQIYSLEVTPQTLADDFGFFTIEIRAFLSNALSDDVDAEDIVQAKTITGIIVNDEGDEPDANAIEDVLDPDGVPDTDKETPGLQTTLRAALNYLEALNLANEVQPAIGFDFNVNTISPEISLPRISNRVNIFGDVNTDVEDLDEARSRVEIDGSETTESTPGLHFLNASNVLVKGLVINNFASHGMLIENSDVVLIQNSFIGTSVNGQQKAGNGGDGVHVTDSQDIEIGSDDNEGLGNVISGNKGNGIQLTGTTPPESSPYIIRGNIIGLAADGSTVLGNESNGVFLNNVGFVEIGGSSDDDENVISANTKDGVLISGEQAKKNTLINNFIGTNRGATEKRGNTNGVRITGGAKENQIGVLTSFRNVISGNNESGVKVEETIAENDVIENNNIIENNFIGLGANGVTNLGNLFHGVHLVNAVANTIQDNIISGNGTVGQITTGDGIRIDGANARRNKLLKNRIGTTADGSTALANRNNGIQITAGVATTQIGDSFPEETPGRPNSPLANLISGNKNHGILVTGPTTESSTQILTTIIGGNLIGTNSEGGTPVPNEGSGIHITGGRDHVDVRGNLVSGNNKSGIDLTNGATNNVIAENQIGTNLLGNTTNLGNGEDGVTLSERANNNTIGNFNRITDNAKAGVRITGEGTTANRILANFIQRNQEGLVIENKANANQVFDANPNEFDDLQISNNKENGIRITNASENTFGSAIVRNNMKNGIVIEDASRNLIEFSRISGNSEHGIAITSTVDDELLGNQIVSNTIIDNTLNGINISNAAGNYLGTRLTRNVNGGNTISGNSTGIRLIGENATRNAILGNAIESNTLIGIDLIKDGSGPTLNDPDSEAVAFANNTQNFPEIVAAVFAALDGGAKQTVGIVGNLNATFPKTRFLLQFFKADATGNQGQTLVHSRFVTTNEIGNASFTTVFQINSPVFDIAGDKITATASRIISTDKGIFLETSEFAPGTPVRVVLADNQDRPDGVIGDQEDDDALGQLGKALLLVDVGDNRKGIAELEVEKGSNLRSVQVVAVNDELQQQLQNAGGDNLQSVGNVIRFEVTPAEDGEAIVNHTPPEGQVFNRFIKLNVDKSTGEATPVLKDGKLAFFDEREARDIEKNGQGVLIVQADAVDQASVKIFLKDNLAPGDQNEEVGVIFDPGLLVLVPETDLEITNGIVPDPVQIGDDLLFTYTVTNNGPEDAEGVSFTETLPDGLTVQAFDVSQGQTNIANGILTANLGTLANGAQATVTITVSSDAAGTFLSEANVVSSLFDSNLVDNTGTQTITFASPPNVDLGEDITLEPGDAINRQGTITDADSNTFTATVDFGDGTGAQPLAINNDNTFDLNVTYPNAGTFRILVTVTDDTGLVGSDTLTVTVNDEDGNVLRLDGSDARDRFLIRRDFRSGGLLVSTFNGQTRRFNRQVITDPVDRIDVFGLGGGDFIFVAPNVFIDTILNGGPGNDFLFGGGGHNVLVGDTGLDYLFGGNQADILIGGDDRDLLFGRGGQDLLIGGSTLFDQDANALAALMSEWKSERTYDERIRNLRGENPGASRANGPTFLIGQGPNRTVFNDNVRDILIAGPGQNAVFADLDRLTGDHLIGFQPFEITERL